MTAMTLWHVLEFSALATAPFISTLLAIPNAANRLSDTPLTKLGPSSDPSRPWELFGLAVFGVSLAGANIWWLTTHPTDWMPWAGFTAVGMLLSFIIHPNYYP
ncbi:MAG: hypothetical protein M0Z36_04395 [Thermaerobacter sp.]|nr:hypothetical protein [Thermaerobacter sp.]